MSTPRIRIRAPAKLNLTLRVCGRRPDGFHELDSLMMALPLGDELLVEPGEPTQAGDVLVLRGPARDGVPTGAENLARRAVEAVRNIARARGTPAGPLRLSLEKNVPAEAGLGGGSSDAAAAALACARLWDLDPEDPEVLEALARLGSDCVFFVRARRSGFARCTGRGERVEPLAPLESPWTLALLTPDFGCSTAAVYAAFQVDDTCARPSAGPRPFASGTLEEARAGLFNQLEAAAERVHPELARFHQRLDGVAPGVFRMAGSGSSWFGFFGDEAAARRALAFFDESEGGRRYGLRGRWLLPLRSARVGASDSELH